MLILGLGWGLLAAGIHAFMYVFVLSASINGLCHYKGYQNFENTATNIRPSRCSPAAKDCTTTITAILEARSSASAAANSIPPGPSSAC